MKTVVIEKHRQLLVTEKTLARLMNVSLRHIMNVRYRKQIPYIRLGRAIRYNPVAVEQALAKLTFQVDEER